MIEDTDVIFVDFDEFFHGDNVDSLIQGVCLQHIFPHLSFSYFSWHLESLTATTRVLDSQMVPRGADQRHYSEDNIQYMENITISDPKVQKPR